jgi:hypothetical protein
MSAVLQWTSTVEDEDEADQSESEDFDDVPIGIGEFITLLQEEARSEDSEQTSAQPE